MKKLIFLLSLTFLFTSLQAQIQQGRHTMSKGAQEAFVVSLKSTNKKEVEDAWSKYVKNYKGKTKKDKKTGEIFSDNAEMDKVSNNTIDVYAKVIEKNEDADLLVWFDLGGAFLNATTHPDRFPAAKAILEKFELSVSTTAVELQIKTQEDALKKMNNELEGFQKDQSDSEADIAKYEKKIEEARQKIKESITAQEMKSSEITGQTKVVKELKDKLKGLK